MEKILIIIFSLTSGIVLGAYVVMPIIRFLNKWHYEKFTPEWKKQVDRGFIEYNGHYFTDNRLDGYVLDEKKLDFAISYKLSSLRIQENGDKKYYDAVIEIINNLN